MLSVCISLPIKYLLTLLGLTYLLPVVAGFYACLFMTVSLLFENKNLPDVYGFIICFSCALVLAYIFRLLDYKFLFNLFFFTPLTIGGVFLVDTSVNTSRPIYADNINPGGSSSEPNQIKYYNNSPAELTNYNSQLRDQLYHMSTCVDKLEDLKKSHDIKCYLDNGNLSISVPTHMSDGQASD